MAKTQEEFVEEEVEKATPKDLAKAMMAHIYEHLEDVIFDGPDTILQTDDGHMFLFQAISYKKEVKNE